MTRIGILALLLAAAAGAAGAGEIKRLEETTPAAGVAEVRLDFPVGELAVVGAAADELRVDLAVVCERERSRCREQAEDLELEVERRGDRLEVRIEGYPKFKSTRLHVEGTITVPRDRRLEIDMGVGELEVEGIDGPLRIDMGVGELRVADAGGDVTIDLGVGEVELALREASVRALTLDAGIGEASLRLPAGRLSGRRSFLIGAELAWHEGPGHSRVAVDLGIGEVVARLD